MPPWIWTTDRAIETASLHVFTTSLSHIPKTLTQPWTRTTHSRLCTTCAHSTKVCAANSPPFSPNGHGSIWSKSKSAILKETGSNGCHLCILIAHTFDGESKRVFGEMIEEETVRLRVGWATAKRDPSGKLGWEERTAMPIVRIEVGDLGGEGGVDEFWLRIRPDGSSGGGGVMREDGGGLGGLCVDLRMVPLSEKTCAGLVMKTVPAKHAPIDNAQNLELASAWIKTCTAEHPMCSSFSPRRKNWRPTRLIHVGSATQQPRLVLSKNLTSQPTYAALSYCRGVKDLNLLTWETERQYRKALPLSTLPATIVEAIDITRKLGYQYIWIDALCIIQDSQRDWERESAQIGNIYGSAIVTLAAAGSSNVTESLFSRRDPRTVRPCVVEIGGSRWITYPSDAERKVMQDFNDNPMGRRAWTLQERVLAPRVLVFGRNQLMWSCVSSEACETFPCGLDPRSSTPLAEQTSLSRLRQRLKIASLDSLPSDFWNDVVQMYTKAELTVRSDKLVALHGIAARIMEDADKGKNERCWPDIDTSYQYLAGLWRDKNFQRNVLWRVKSGAERTRPRGYRAPSWSWAAVDGEIVAFEQYVFWAWNRSDVEMASVLDTRIQEAPPPTGSEVTTGQVVSGHLDLRCHLRKCYLRRSGWSESQFLPSETAQTDAVMMSLDTPNAHDDGKKTPKPLEESLDSLAEYENLDYPDEASDAGWTEIHNSNQDVLKTVDFSPADEAKLQLFSQYCTLDCPSELSESEYTEVYCVPLQLASAETDRYEAAVWESYEGLILVPVKLVEPLSASRELGGERLPMMTSPYPTFKRIGIFAYYVNNQNRGVREQQLFGSVGRREKVDVRIL